MASSADTGSQQAASRKRLFGQRTSVASSTGSQSSVTFPSKFEDLVQELSGTHTDILEPDRKKQVESLVFVAKQQVTRNKIDKIVLGKIVRQHQNFLPLEFLWMLQSAEILNFSLYIAGLSNEKLTEMSARLATFLDSNRGNVANGIAVDFLKTCINLVHGPTPPSILNPVRKSCRALVTAILKKVIFPLDDTNQSVPWWLSKLVKDLPSVIVMRLVENVLEVQLTSPPFISVHQALARQAEWKDGRKSFDFLFQSCTSSTIALNALVKVLNDTREVNWKAVLISIASFLHNFSDSKGKLTELISAWLAQSLSNDDKETLLLSFILARQLSHSCPPAPYANWFRKCFGHRQTTMCKTEQQFKFLLQFLIQLVPHEPLACLKVHQELPPFVPISLKEMLKDFLMIASSRLKDLTPASDLGIFQGDAKIGSIAEQAQYDADRAIASFAANNKVHESVMTANIFKKKYFETHFLPALLMPKQNTRPNDPQIRLVDSLLRSKKISEAQFEIFQQRCLEVFRHKC